MWCSAGCRPLGGAERSRSVLKPQEINRRLSFFFRPQMDQVSDEEVSVREEEEEEEEDSDKEDQDLDKMFGAWLGELDKLTQVHKVRKGPDLLCMENITHTHTHTVDLVLMTHVVSVQSLDDGRPEQPPQQKAPLRQETNMANFSYRFSIYNINGQTFFLSPLTVGDVSFGLFSFYNRSSFRLVERKCSKYTFR